MKLYCEAPVLEFSLHDDGTLEISDPDDQSAVWYFSASEALRLGEWLTETFGELTETVN